MQWRVRRSVERADACAGARVVEHVASKHLTFLKGGACIHTRAVSQCRRIGGRRSTVAVRQEKRIRNITEPTEQHEEQPATQWQEECDCTSTALTMAQKSPRCLKPA